MARLKIFIEYFLDGYTDMTISLKIQHQFYFTKLKIETQLERKMKHDIFLIKIFSKLFNA